MKKIMAANWWKLSASQRMKTQEQTKAACRPVTKVMPLMKGDCIDGMSANFQKLSDIFRQFSKDHKNISGLKKSLLEAKEKLRSKTCLANMGENQKNCKKYIADHLRSARHHIFNRSDEHGHDRVLSHHHHRHHHHHKHHDKHHGSDESLRNKIGQKIKDLNGVAKGFLRDSFWLNAPEDCGVNHKNGVNEKIKHSFEGLAGWFKKLPKWSKNHGGKI